MCVFQLEKILQQGDIGECCEPYMVMKESDSIKVHEHTRGLAREFHQGWLWYATRISQLGLDCCNICQSFSIWARSSRCWSVSLYRSSAKLLFLVVWNGISCNAAHLLPLHGHCSIEFDLFVCLSVCLCSYSIRRSWRSWSHKLSRCAPGWDGSGCPLPGRQFISLTSWAASEGLSAPIQTRIRVLTWCLA